MKRLRINYRLKTDLMGYLLVAPMLLGMAVFVAYPMFQALLYSFQNTNGISGKWNGVKNYAWLFQDEFFWKSMFNTLYMALFSILTGVSVCFLLACMINSLTAAKNFFKSVFFLPNVVSIIAVSILFKFILFPTDQGLLNFVLSKMGIAPIGWFTDPAWARGSIVIMNLWKSIGYDTILFLAGLQSVSRELYEAAEVDGAGGIKKWWYITLPCMKPVFVFVVIMYTINSLKRFGDVWMIGGEAGNPGGVLQTIVLYIYRNAWTTSNVGVASAAAYMLFLLSLVLTLINYKCFGLGRPEQ